MRQHRSRDLDLVIEREPAYHPQRGVGNHRQTLSEGRARRHLDLLEQPGHDVVEQRDLLAREPAGSGYEKIGHPSQGLGPPPDIRTGERVLEFMKPSSDITQGRPNKKPCTCVTPAARNSSNCSSVSTPSAVVAISRPCA